MGAGLYGVLIALAIFVSGKLPQPEGSLILWGLFSVQLSCATVVCWRRTGLLLATAALAVGAVVSLLFVVLAVAGEPFPNVRPGFWILGGLGAAAGPLLLFIESRVSRREWAQWARHMEHASVLDILTCRHIPRLRSGDV